jgi:NitT/TauT family transport system permease protein
VISETVASNAGIGYLMLQAYSSFRVPLMFAGLFAIAVIAIIMYGIAVWIEQRLTGWSVRGTENTTFTGGG